MFGISLLLIYKLMAVVVALMMVVAMFRENNWQNQLMAIMVFVPFALRAVGVK